MSFSPLPVRLTAITTFSLIMIASAQAQVVVRDAETGQLRAATSVEAQALNKAAAPSSRVAQQRIGMITGKVNPQPIVHADGTVEQELDASTMSYTVAKRNDDGTISMVCVTGQDAAAKVLAAKPVRSFARQQQGGNHDVK